MEKPKTTFTQKSHGTGLVFEFKEESLAFTHEDATGENNRNVPYETIDMCDPSTLLVKSYIRKRPETYMFVAAIAMASVYSSADISLSLIWAIVFLGWGTYMRSVSRRGMKYTFFKVHDGSKIRIMQDKQHDIILAELKTHWIARLKKLYGAINWANDPAKELLKYQWLRKINVLSEEEFEQIQAQIRPPEVGDLPRLFQPVITEDFRTAANSLGVR